MSWHEHVTISENYKLLYKGIDLGFSSEFIQDLHAQTAMDLSDEYVEGIYNKHISVIRDKKIEEILN